MGSRASTMNVFQIMDYLTSIEQRYGVSDWTINDIHIWPFLRVHIYYTLFEHFDEHYSFPSANRTAFHKIKTVFNIIFSYAHSRFQKRYKSYDAFILDDGISYDRLDGQWFGKFTDPLYQKLNAENKSALILSSHKNFLHPRATSCFHIALPLLIKNVIAHIKPPLQHLSISDLNDFQGELEEKFPNIKWNLKKLSKQQSLKTNISADYYKSLIQKFNIKECYVVNYYNPYNAGLCKACWDLSIPSHEIQHGVQSFGHPAYAQWSNVPSIGYNSMPNHFACWQQADINIIEQWSKNTPHNAYILGNLYLEKLKTEKTKDHKKFTALLKRINFEHKKDYNYLITLQAGMGLPKVLIDILLQSQNAYLWIRMHPTDIYNTPKIVRQLDELHFKNYNIMEASRTPLYILIPHMNAHITLNSSTVIEAAYFNVPSLILDETGALYYQEYIKQGSAFYETDTKKALIRLNNLISLKS